MRTKLAKGTPWPHKKPANKQDVNLDAVQKCADPYRPERIVQRHKYDELFANVKEGDCFRCPDAKTTAAVARALRMHFKRNGLDGVIRQNVKTDDGVCRVWAVKVFKEQRA